MGRYFDIDVSEIREFANHLRMAEADFNNQMETFAEAVGYEFLRIVEDEIIRRNVVDTRLLLHSFTKGDSNNIWTLTDDGGKITIEVGTNLEYASYVNDGHWTCKKGESKRFVPGYWIDDGKDDKSFIYDPSSSTGMVLKQQWVDAQPYYTSAEKIIEKMFPELLETKLQKWINKYFGD